MLFTHIFENSILRTLNKNILLLKITILIFLNYKLSIKEYSF